MKKMSLAFMAFSMATLTASAGIESVYKLKVLRNGQEHQQVAYTFWSGEYPSPVIDVNSKVKGTTKIQGYSSLRNLTTGLKSCTIKNGLYHPWADRTKSLLEMYTIAGQNDYIVMNTLPDNKEFEGIKIGMRIENVVYASEGFYVGHVSLNGETKQVDIFDDLLQDPTLIKPVNQSTSLEEQWLYLKCDEGYKVFVQDLEILKQKGVKEGTILKYGKVGPSEN